MSNPAYTGPARHAAAVLPFILTCALASATVAAETHDRAHTWRTGDANLEWGPCPDFMPEGCRIAVLQGNPEEPNADVFFRLPGNSTAPHHHHTSAERMVLVEGEMEVDYDGQDPVRLQQGSYAYGPPLLAHTASCVSSEPCVLFIAFEEPVDAIPGAPE
jgi:quercetin dioxygenase-like cupin family protein